MTDRCEPPEHLRGVDGWHWVETQAGTTHIARWWRSENPGIEPLWASEHLASATPAWAAAERKWRYIAPVATPAEVEALRAQVMRAGAECSDMGSEIVRLRAEVASLRVTLGQQPPTEGAESVGCPLPGMCVMVHDNATLRARVDALEAALIPFARYSKKFPEADANAPLTVFVSDIPRMGDCHAARAALEEKP